MIFLIVPKMVQFWGPPRKISVFLGYNGTLLAWHIFFVITAVLEQNKAKRKISPWCNLMPGDYNCWLGNPSPEKWPYNQK